MSDLVKLINDLFDKDNVKIKYIPFTENQISALSFILSLKIIGFTDKEIVELINKRCV